jgi:hypothetical protein
VWARTLLYLRFPVPRPEQRCICSVLRKNALNALGEIASEQAGYATAAQALRLGLEHDDLARLVRAGDLRRVRHGVDAMRHAQRTHEEEIAAWLSLERNSLPWERRGDRHGVLPMKVPRRSTASARLFRRSRRSPSGQTSRAIRGRAIFACIVLRCDLRIGRGRGWVRCCFQ